MNPLNILFLIDHFETNYPRDQNYIISYMKERGHNVIILTSRNKRYERFDVIAYPAVNILRAPVLFNIKQAKVFFSPKMMLSFIKYDVVHSFTFFTFSAFYGMFVNAPMKVIRSEIGPPNGLTFIKAKEIGLYSFLKELYKRFYTYFTVYNQVEMKSLEILNFPSERILVLPPMIDYYKFSLLGNRNFQREYLNVGVISRLVPEKGVHRLIPMLHIIRRLNPQILKKTRWYLAGRAENQRYAYMVLEGLKTLLGDSFTYLGEIAPPYDFYRLVDIVIVPSLSETGAIVPLEAMAAGKIVVASNIYPINLYIKHCENGYLFDTPQDAAKILTEILSGSFDLAAVSRKAQKYALKHDYRVVCEKLERVYQRAYT